MKRIGRMLSLALVAAVIAGCDSGGIQEGMSTTPAEEGGAPAGFRAEMEKNAKNMQLKGAKPKPGTKKAG